MNYELLQYELPVQVPVLVECHIFVCISFIHATVSGHPFSTHAFLQPSHDDRMTNSHFTMSSVKLVPYILFVLTATITTLITTTSCSPLALALSSNVNTKHTTSTTITRIQVCQNKDCCQRFQGRAANLVQTLRQIITTTEAERLPIIESTGCLSHCDKGPNIRMVMSNGMDVVEHGVDSAHAAAAVLELIDSDLKIHPTMLAAWKVMEQAHQGNNNYCRTRYSTGFCMLHRQLHYTWKQSGFIL